MANDMHFRWLGTAGMELESGGERILIDPFLSRFPIRYTLFGRPAPKPALVARYLSPARAVLVSHAHYDHLADVPNVCREFGAVAYGSENTSAILRAHELPAAQIKTINAGDAISIGPFEVGVFAGQHGRMAGLLPFTGKLPARLHPPLRLSDYRMDSMFSFRVQAAGASCLIWNGPDKRGIPTADILFFCPLWGARICAAVAVAAQVRIIVPVHWDDFFSPLDRPFHPLVAPPGWSSPWFRRMDPRAFARSLNRLLPEVRVLIPELLKHNPI
ncbi:MAG: MBL fold metallo-hydrolase [Anaerolineales bacterium]